MALSGEVHRPSALKKKNKKHNKLGHRTKRQIDSENKGRVDAKTLLKAHKKELSKEQRRHQSKQIRANKREEAISAKRQLGTDKTPPFLVSVVPLSININPKKVLHFLSSCDDSSDSSISQQGVMHLSCPRLKQRFSFLVPPVTDLYAVLDAVKGSDTVLFVWKVGEELDDSANMMLSSLLSQGLPSTLHAVIGEEELSSKKKMRILKELQQDISSKFPGPVRPYYLNKLQDVNLILRQIGGQKRKSVFYKDQRSHLVAEKVSFEGEGSTGTLKLEGYVRSQPLSVNKLIHIPGWGEFQLDRIDLLPDPFPLLVNRRKKLEDHSCDEPQLLDFANPEIRESLDSMCNEEEMAETEEFLETGLNDEEVAVEKKKKRLKGQAEFISAWEMDRIDNDISDDEESSSVMDDACSLMSKGTDDFGSQKSETAHCDDQEGDDDDDEDDDDDDNDNYDAKVDYEAEMNFFEKMKAANEDAEFPDEVDTPKEILARIRFQKYRGLQSFRTSPWDLNENLPLEYKTCFSVKSFGHLKNRILKMDKEGALPGWYVLIYVKDVPRHIYNEHVKTQSPIVTFSLLPYEQKMTVSHVLLMSHPQGHIRPIKSKERLIYHIGFRRFANSAIFSEHARGDKYKYFRFFHPGQTVVASMYSPVTFPPCPVSVFRERPDGAQELVATGQLLKPDLNRVICKRVVLSGYPFKINRKSAVIRQMFHYRQDIEYFKSVELKTKWGRRGHIKEPLGTKGHMKCQFDGQLKSQDTVLMYLYKRVFPKWRYDPVVSRPPPLFPFHLGKLREEEEDSNIDKLIEMQTKKKRVQFL